ncbi:MAG: addiction module protein [Rhizobacter sp.]|nr:addiction module protein [Rhizobacter sp.]
MSDSIADLASKARALPPEDRARLAEQLLETLQESPSAEVEAEWDAEIQRRIAALDWARAKACLPPRSLLGSAKLLGELAARFLPEAQAELLAEALFLSTPK